MNHYWNLLIGLLLAILAVTARGEQFVEQGAYRIHYSAFNSAFLTADIARQYRLERSRYRAVINLAARRQVGETAMDSRAVPAQVEIKVRALNGRPQWVEAREVREGEAIYYLATFPFQNLETYFFDIRVKPEGETAWIPVQFRQDFLVD